MTFSLLNSHQMFTFWYFSWSTFIMCLRSKYMYFENVNICRLWAILFICPIRASKRHKGHPPSPLSFLCIRESEELIRKSGSHFVGMNTTMYYSTLQYSHSFISIKAVYMLHFPPPKRGWTLRLEIHLLN